MDCSVLIQMCICTTVPLIITKQRMVILWNKLSMIFQVYSKQQKDALELWLCNNRDILAWFTICLQQSDAIKALGPTSLFSRQYSHIGFWSAFHFLAYGDSFLFFCFVLLELRDAAHGGYRMLLLKTFWGTKCEYHSFSLNNIHICCKI